MSEHIEEHGTFQGVEEGTEKGTYAAETSLPDDTREFEPFEDYPDHESGRQDDGADDLTPDLDVNPER
jgi:hypothetical protein